MANQEEVVYNNEANYNGAPINKDEITTYFAKDLFRFMVSDIQRTNDGVRYISITPCGYDVKKFILANIDFRIKKWGNNEGLQNWRKNAENDKLIYKGLDILY
ncbi:MAG: hypothetical protein ACYCWE_03325 [Eubacteriales bacterium]